MFIFPYRDENPTRTYPGVTVLLITVNVVLYLIPALIGKLPELYAVYGFTPNQILVNPKGLFTSMFLHAGLLHLISNMWFLWLFGDNIEDHYGHFRFLGMYILAGLSGNLVHALFSLFMSGIPVIGASGAVAGVMGGYLLTYPTAKLKCLFLLIIFPIFFRLWAAIFIGLWIIGQFFNAFFGINSHVAHWAHIGGFLYGFMWVRKMHREDA
ncbi:MAG: rhomboid family intramembrane serine protease [Calditrichaeota bacterium]|nr:rhomboid family intramembrane serine protease [Calditrichota bacterium]MBT7790539.1 rhomboid family intramembrane serine protease [Calditrichota bacterium]